MADGAITLPDGVPTQVTVERPRQQGHGDYATNVALQLAKKAGTNPRAFADLVAERLRAADGVAEVEVAGPGFLNVTVEAGAQGQVAADIVAAGAAYGRSDDPGRPVDQHRVHLGQPDRPAAPRSHPVGRARRRHRARARGGGRIGGARVLLQRPRRPDGPLRRLPRGLRARQPDPRGRLPGGATSPTWRRTIVRRQPDIVDLPEGERLAAFREAGYALQLQEQQDQLRRLQHPLRRVVLRARPPCRRVARLGGRHPAQPQGQRSPLRGRRRAVDAHHGVRRRQGPGAHPVQRRARPTSPRTPPTTSTSARAASTTASTCSAPTTTATSVGCGRWPRASVTTRRRRWTC